jgi:hypothetical protein
MSVSRATRTRSVSQRAGLGLAAIGSSGPWEIAVDQTTAGPDRWYAQIEGPLIYIRFEISSLQVIDQAIHFLARTNVGKNSVAGRTERTLSLGADRSTKIELVQDDEFNDRIFLVVAPKGGLLARFTIGGDDLTRLVAALRQANEDVVENARGA